MQVSLRSKVVAVLALTLILAASASLPVNAVVTPNGLTLTVYPDGSVNVAFNSIQSQMLTPGTQPSITSHVRATTAGTQTTITANETVSLPSSLLNQAPYNYSASISASGSYSNGISDGSIVVQAVPGVSFPGASLKVSYHGNSNSLSVSGNTTVQYGAYGSGQGQVVLNASTIGQYLQMLQSEGLNSSNIQNILAKANAAFPQGGFSLTSFALSPSYGSNSATVEVDLHLTGNMSALPFLFAGLYSGLFFTVTPPPQVSETAVLCNPQAPGACVVTLQNTGGASASVSGCYLEDQSGNTTIGTVYPPNPTIPAGGSAQVVCRLPSGVSGGSTASLAFGWFYLVNGNPVYFDGVWNPSAQVTITTMSTTAVSTTTSQQSILVLGLLHVYSTVTSSIHEYTYTMTYASGIMAFSERLVAAENLNLNQAGKLFASYAAGQGAPPSQVEFLNTTRVDISGFSADVNEAQKPSGEYDMSISVSGLTIYPHVVKIGGMLNESSLFNFLGGSQANVTVAGGTNADGSVTVVVPAGVSPPTTSTANSKTWNDVNANALAGLEFSVGQASTTSSSSSTTTSTSASKTSSSTTTSAGGGIPEFPVQFGFALLVTVVIVTAYIAARRGLRIDRPVPI